MELIINIVLIILFCLSMLYFATTFTYTTVALKQMLTWHKRFYLIGMLPAFFMIIVLFVYITIRFTPTVDTNEYKQGYQDALNTKFEQRIDTVYYRKE